MFTQKYMPKLKKPTSGLFLYISKQKGTKKVDLHGEPLKTKEASMSKRAQHAVE